MKMIHANTLAKRSARKNYKTGNPGRQRGIRSKYGPCMLDAPSESPEPAKNVRTTRARVSCIQNSTKNQSMNPRIQLKLFVLVVFLAAVCVADLPIHCLHKQVLGTWQFNLGADSSDRSETCGYETPDSNVQHFTRYSYELETKKTVSITLSEPNIAKMGETVGTWTMVYDEGFEVKMGGQTFFAFFAYEPKSVAQLSSTKARDYLSHCDRTMIGWFHGANNRNWGCFQAQKTGVTAWRPPKFNSNAKNRLGADAVVAPVSSLLEVGSSSNLNAEAFVADQALIDSINEDESSLWRAMTPDFSGSLLEVDQMLGKTVFSKQDLRAGAASIISLETKIKQHLTTGQYHWTTADAEMETLHSVPRSVDWRRIMADNGAIQDWTGPVRNQGHCGSCYAFSVAAMAESRIRVATKNQDKPVLSTQAMLSCSVTNQGCMGGYPFLLAKHAAEQGFVSESCLPYSRFVKTTQCSAKCQNGDAFIATEYGYIGGFYGGSSEAAMMKQLAEHGPFSVALQAPRDLFYYMDGIFKGPKGRIEQGWEETNHAVVVVGYGVDDSKSPPIKYWIVQNTWGTRWGDHGYFKIVRGIDECAIESMPVYGLFKRSPHGSAFLELSSMVGNAEEME